MKIGHPVDRAAAARTMRRLRAMHPNDRRLFNLMLSQWASNFLARMQRLRRIGHASR